MQTYRNAQIGINLKNEKGTNPINKVEFIVKMDYFQVGATGE